MTSEEKQIDHEYTDEIVCPYCCFEFKDSWEISDAGESVQTCWECQKKFVLCVDHSISYSTHKINKGTK